LNNKGADKNECLYGGDSGIITPIMQVATPATTHLLTINTDAKTFDHQNLKHSFANMQELIFKLL